MRKEGRTAARPEEWGALGAWGWGLSRALDYLVTNPAVDARRVAVFGHSRHGKAALWAGAAGRALCPGDFERQRRRGRVAGSPRLRRNDRLFHRARRPPILPSLPRIRGRTDELPFDQHMLLALVAPRPLYIASATEDNLADPRGEFLSAVHAAPVYRLFGHEGLDTAELPPPDRSIGHRIGYHLRTGKHDITAYDWEQYLNFADRHFAK